MVRASSQGFSLEGATERLGLYLVALTILLPLGLPLALMYRGTWWREGIGCILGFVAFYALYSYDAARSGGVKQVLLLSRFMLPVVPLVIVMALRSRGLGWLAEWQGRHPRLTRGNVWLWIVCGVGALGSWLLHSELHRAQMAQASVRKSLYANTTESDIIGVDGNYAAKYFNLGYGRRAIKNTSYLSAEELAVWAREAQNGKGDVCFVLPRRPESEYWQGRREQLEAAIAILRHQDGVIVREIGAGEGVSLCCVKVRERGLMGGEASPRRYSR